MRAMILAAGQGKRLRPITNTIPKPMVSAGGKSLILWHIERLKALGITDLVVNGAYLKEVLFNYLGDGSQFGVTIKQSPEDADGLETAGGIIKALPLLIADSQEQEPFLVINGDVFIAGNYDFVLPPPALLTTIGASSAPNTPNAISSSADPQLLAHLYLTKNPAHNLKGDYTIAANGLLQYGSDYTFAGVAWYRPQAFQGIAVERLPLRPFFDSWVANNQISASLLPHPWFDVGTVERLNELEQFLLAHPQA